MFYRLKFLFPLIYLTVFCSYNFLQGQVSKSKKPIFVIVHGAWGGSWAFKKVDSLLTEKGCIVYRPSLTGLGERYHLASMDIGLKTHINDVINEIIFEDLTDVILVGHSYGGMVITGVVDSIPQRIKKIVYLDAFLPEDGESVSTINGNRNHWFDKMVKGGFIEPAWVKPGSPFPHDVPHPLKTFTDPIELRHKSLGIPATYILTVAKGTNPKDDDFASQAERARKNGWKVLQLEADHNAQ